MTLSGESEIELEGGRTLRFGPGHILLAEDTTGQGHKSRAVPGTDRVALDIVLGRRGDAPQVTAVSGTRPQIQNDRDRERDFFRRLYEKALTVRIHHEVPPVERCGRHGHAGSK